MFHVHLKSAEGSGPCHPQCMIQNDEEIATWVLLISVHGSKSVARRYSIPLSQPSQRAIDNFKVG